MRDGEKFRLGDLCEIVKGNTPIMKAMPGKYPLIVTAEARRSCESYQFDCKAVLVPLVSSTGHGHASIKRINYQEGKFAVGTILCAVISKDESLLDPKFLHTYFSYFKDQLIVPLMKGAANVTLSIRRLAELEIILPPIDVQRRVVEIAENDTAQKELEEEITHQQTLLTKLKQAILKEAIEGKLTADWRAENPDVEPASELLERIQSEKAQLIADKEIRKEAPLPEITLEEIPFVIPEGWEWCRLGDVNIDYSGGATYKSNEILDKGENQVIRIGNIKPDRIDLAKRPAFVSESLAKQTTGNELFSDDFLFTMTGTYQKRDYCFSVLLQPNHFQGMRLFQNQRVGRFRIHDSLLKTFLIKALKIDDLLNPVFESATGAANQANISKGALMSIIIPVPPLTEQSEIVYRVETLMTNCNKLEKEIENSRTNAANLLQAVLKEAFSTNTNA